MDIIELSAEDYRRRLVNVSCGYNKEEFCEYNRHKVDTVQYLLFRDGKKERFVVPFGSRDGVMKTPFSAPFSVVGEISRETGLEHYREALYALKGYAGRNGIREVRITFPPYFYDEKKISYWINAAFLEGWETANCDLNYAFDLKKIETEGYENCLSVNGRRNLRISYECGNEFIFCTTSDDEKLAYEIIEENRRSKGYPLRMTCEQVAWTKKLLNGRSFLVRNKEDHIAAAVVFEVHNRIAQLIYWGDIPGYQENKPVNFLAEQLIAFYTKRGFAYLDVGPSTENSLPNLGLCRFKESIGCEVSNKITIRLRVGD